MKKIILLLAIAILAIQLVAAPNNEPSESITAKLSFGDVNLPSGIVAGYNLTMQNDALLSVFNIESKAVYFIVGDDPAFYRKTTEGNIQLFEVPFDEEINLRATAVTEDASDIIINGLPYFFAYGDRLGFDLNVDFDGSLYSILFGRVNSNSAISIEDNAGKGLFLYNDNSGNFVLVKDNNNLADYNLATPQIITFRAPIAAGGENEAEAEARRIERAGARADINVGNCVDIDAALEQYSTASYGYDETGTFLSDFCAADIRAGVGKRILNEVKCNADGSLYLEEYECTGVCQNGACTATEGGEVAFCYDSDTIGEATDLNYNKIETMARTKGVVAGFYAAGSDISYGLWDDSCASDKELVEYSCKNHKVRFFTINCLSGCSEGKCASQPYCFDTDGGNNVNAQGKIIFSRANSQGNVNGDTKLDVCYNATTVEEKICTEQLTTAGMPWDSVLVNCPNGCQAGRCLKEGEIARQVCTTKSDCAFSQGCVNGFCGQCTKAQDCGAGFVCSSPDKRCKPASGRCQTDTNCKIGKYCNPRVGQLGFCENEPLNSLDDISAALTRRWKRINVYARVIAGAEVLHGLELPEKAANGQACLVDDQCMANECSPDTGTCAGAEFDANPDQLDPDTPDTVTLDDLTATNRDWTGTNTPRI